jgi:hypothetical protein
MNSTRLARLARPLLTLISLPLQAAYDPAIVGADARWVIHADLNGLRHSTLGKELVAALEKAQAQTTGGTIGIDISKLLATVGSLTAYGTNLMADPKAIDGTLLAQGTADLRKIAESLMLQGTLAQPKVFSEISDLPFPAYGISDPKAKTEDKLQVMIAFPPEPVIILSKSKAQIIKARDVFRGAAASLAKNPDSPLARLQGQAEGAYLYSAMIVPNEPVFPQNAPQARVMQLMQSGAVALGERGSDTFAHAELLASSDANAEKLMKILQGMTSMLSLAETNDRQLADFMNATSVSRDKNTVTLDLAYSSARLAQMVQLLRTQAEAKPVSRQQVIIMGRPVAEWGGEAEPADAAVATPGPDGLATRTIENVILQNGSLVTLGRTLTGNRASRIEQVEITPATGGSPLVFRAAFMRSVRGNMMQFPFPGAEGTYNLKVSYLPDPEGKTKYAVSVVEPKLPPGPPAAAPNRDR